MITKTFIAKEHQDYGTIGFQLKGKSMFDPLMGMACAHDCLEHFNDDDGMLHQEYMAFGAMILTRGDGGYFNGRSSSVGENLASDFINLWHYARHNGNYCKVPPNTRKLSEEFEATVAEMERGAVEQLQNECDVTLEEAKDFIKHVRSWMRIGYRKATKRYRGVTSCELTYLFQEIEKEIDKALKNAVEGQEYTLRYNLDTQRVYVDEVMEDY